MRRLFVTIFNSVFPFSLFIVLGDSMLPTLKSGERLFVNRLAFLFVSPKIGDIVATKDPRDKKILIKRITKIADKKYFVTGDNKKASTDSREFGMLKKRDIIGKVIGL